MRSARCVLIGSLVLALSCVLYLPAASALPAAQQAEPKIDSFTLSNGLEVIVIENHRVPAITHMMWYRVGSADDPQGKSGLAHFHEHIMFLGTSGYKAGEFSNIVSRHGGQDNAFTGYDATSYYINIAKEHLPLAMDLEADRMRGLTPSDEAVDKEKQVIIEERRMRVENVPDALLAEQMNAALFRNHPYRIPVIGWKHEMEGLTKQDVLAFHRVWYHPNNAILIISGDVTTAEIKPLVQRYYGKLPKAVLPMRQWTDEPPQNAARRVALRHTNVKQPVWYRTYAASGLRYGKKDDALALFVLAQVMGEGKSSRLYQELVVKRKVATGVSVSYNGFTLGPAEFSISVMPSKDVDLESIEKAVEETIAETKLAGFSAEEIQRAKAQLKAEAIYARDGLPSMAQIMGWIRIVGLDTRYFGRWPQLIEEVETASIAQVMQDTLSVERSVTGWLLPQHENVSPSSPQGER